MKHITIDIMFDDLKPEVQSQFLEALKLESAEDGNFDTMPIAVYETDVCECPNGGDESEGCADCPYAVDYQFCNGECVERKPECNGCDSCDGHCEK